MGEVRGGYEPSPEEINLVEQEQEPDDVRVKEQRVSTQESQKGFTERIAADMGLEITFEPSKDFHPPVIDVVFKGTRQTNVRINREGERISRTR